MVSLGVPLEAQVAELQRQAFLEIPRGHADRVEPLDERQHALDLRFRPASHRGNLLD